MRALTRAGALIGLCLALSVMPAAGAQDLGDVTDFSCGPSVEGPSAGPNSHEITVRGLYACATNRASIGVIVCLEYNGVVVRCAQEASLDDKDAEATVSFVCLPGIWTATVQGVATGGSPGLAVGALMPGDCDPLRVSPRLAP